MLRHLKKRIHGQNATSNAGFRKLEISRVLHCFHLLAFSIFQVHSSAAMDFESSDTNGGDKIPKNAKIMSRDDLAKLDKEDLVDKVISMQAYIKQLKCIINKQLHGAKESDNKQESSKKKKSTRPFDFSRYTERHIFLRFLYLGGGYDGFVVQDQTINTVEAVLFEALLKTKLIQSRETANYNRCGRTDKGVSAFSQVVSLTVRSQLKKQVEPEIKDIPENQISEIQQLEIDYISALNGVLPKDIRVIAWAPIASPTISARFECRRRRYHYYFPRGQLNVEAMNEAAGHLLGTHDFRNLCKMDVSNGVLNYVRNVHAASVRLISALAEESSPSASAPVHYSMYLFTIEASAFLWHQIRCIMSVLFLVGQEKEPPSIVKALLDTQATPAKPQYGLAPDRPLVLFAATYDADTLSSGWYYGSPSALKSTICRLHEEWSASAVQAAILQDMLISLVQEYAGGVFEREAVSNDNLTFADIDSAPRVFLSGTNSRTYRPLLTRPVCASLESRQEKMSSKKRIKLQM